MDKSVGMVGRVDYALDTDERVEEDWGRNVAVVGFAI